MPRAAGLLIALLLGCQVAGGGLASSASAQGFQDLFGGDIQGLGDGSEAPKIKASGWFTKAQGEEAARLHVQADISKGWHTYSITQPRGGPLATKIKLEESDQYQVTGDFQPVPPPEKHFDGAFKMEVEEHEGQVIWHAPIKLAEGVDPATLKITGSIFAQACEKVCLAPQNYKFTAALGAKKIDTSASPASSNSAGSAVSSGSYKSPLSHGLLEGRITPQSISPEHRKFQIVLTARPDASYHTYYLSESPKEGPGNKPTLIAITDQPQGWKFSKPQASQVPKVGGATPYYNGEVTFTIDVEAPAGIEPGAAGRIAGVIGFQFCTEHTCDRPQAAEFAVDVPVTRTVTEGTLPLEFREGDYDEVAELFGQGTSAPGPSKPLVAADGHLLWEPYSQDYLQTLSPVQPDKIETKTAGDDLSLGTVLGLGFLAGFFLNFMPCVLPVIGLKVMSFVQQAGESRSRVFALNAWYALGMLAVFWVLGGAAIWLGIGWGQQFSSPTFTIVMTSVVFAFALSMLGVWEIPIPGFVGSGKAMEVAEREGLSGAFTKGVLTTILATPCTGPFLGTALTWALRQSPAVVFATFSSVGLGMASPYLVLGAFPRLISFLLPKPGAWMDTFKNIMGFVLLGTVVWLMLSIPAAAVVPTVALLFGIWAACWWIGKVPVTADLHHKLQGWAAGIIVIGATVLIAFAGFKLGPVQFGGLHSVADESLTWKIDSRVGEILHGQASGESGLSSVALRQDRPPGRYTVMVDFTANWCATCKLNEKIALNVEDTQELVRENNVVALKADLTEENPDANALLDQLKVREGGIPVLAIFPADKPNQPIVLQGPIYRSDVLKALREAGPSVIDDEASRTAMRP